MYIMFPIGWMYYFGTNLDAKFSVPDFWPRPEQQHKIPFERDEIESELQRLQRRRLELRTRRLREEQAEQAANGMENGHVENLGVQDAVSGLNGFNKSLAGGPLDQLGDNAAQQAQQAKKSWSEWVRGR
jgi:protein PET100, fungi type